jgi:hypothetical protein
LSSPLVLAHAGHWAEDAIFLAPVLVLFIWLWFQSLREKRSRRRS